VLLAGLTAVASLILVAITHEPKPAVSSPRPAKAAIVPQIADAKSEAEILFRGKSFAAYKRLMVMYFTGVVTGVPVSMGQTVKEGEALAAFTLDREAMIRVHSVIYPAEVRNLKRSLYGQKMSLKTLKDSKLPVSKLRLDKEKKDLADTRELYSRGMAYADAVKNRERTLTGAKKEILAIQDSIKRGEDGLKKSDKDLDFAEGKHRRHLELLEWQTGRSYSDKSIPFNKAFLRAPIDGQIIWMSPRLQVKSRLVKGTKVLVIAPPNAVVVRCKVHELDLVKLKTGDRGTVRFDAIPEKEYSCKVTRIPWMSRNPALEVPADYEIECALDKPDGTLKEGLTCNVKVTVTN